MLFLRLNRLPIP